MDVAALIHGAGGFVRTLGPRVVRSSADEAVLRLDAASGETLQPFLLSAEPRSFQSMSRLAKKGRVSISGI